MYLWHPHVHAISYMYVHGQINGLTNPNMLALGLTLGVDNFASFVDVKAWNTQRRYIGSTASLKARVLHGPTIPPSQKYGKIYRKP